MSKQAIYQVGTINSLLEAVYAGDTSVKKLKEHGDFGLGALDNIDGELIVCDGKFYRANASGKLNQLEDSCKTPFAVVNQFKPDITFSVNKQNYAQLEQTILPYFASLNLIYAIRVKGYFKHLSLRSEECTQRPYRRLVEILPSLQRTFYHENIEGQLIGVWFPKYLAQVNVPGFHFHFIDNDCLVGGHVFGLELESASVEIQTLHSFQMDLIQSDDFYKANLDIYNSDAVAQVEQVRT